ncbi:MAG: translation initiation factor IF-2 [Corynebacterium sp.]|nr:translation initiation factor IF-2 [Corynebacterium sp.]
MVNDFEEFAQKFRNRAAARLTEFEKILDKAQRDLESGTKKAVRAQQQTKTPETLRPMDYREPQLPTMARIQQTPAPTRAVQGQVKSVLRKAD